MIGVAVVGVGYWGINHVRVFASERQAALRWVCDPDPRALERASELAPQAQATESLGRVLEDPAVDAIVIASPAVTHAELACRALAAGKHVLVEKPLALNIEDAERVAATASAAHRTVLVGHLMLYHPAVIALRDIVRSGELGDIHCLHATRVNLGRPRRDENVLWSLGPHDLSILDFLLDEAPVTLAAHGEAYLRPGVEDVVFLTVRYRQGLLGHVHLSWLNPHKERRVTVVGSRKMAEFDDTASDNLRVFDRGYDRPPEFTRFDEFLTIRHGGVHSPRIAMAEPLRVMAQHFLACCRGEESPRTDAASGVRIVRALAAAQASLVERGAVVPFPAATPPRP